jgi:citrate synthase
LLGHLAEEKRHPVGMDVYLTVEHNTDYQPVPAQADDPQEPPPEGS